jgi:UDP-N-acetylglucosamine 2-epimerase (non-hydrolysing)
MGLKPDKYFVVSAHREENINVKNNFNRLVQILNELAKEYNLPVIVSTHPRTRKMIEENQIELNPLVQLMKPFRFTDYVALQIDAYAVLSDSGTISEESSILNFPALNLREAHERPEAMEEASVMMVGMNLQRIFQALSVIRDQPRKDESILRIVSDYSIPNVSEKVVRIIISYIDYIRRTVWSESI